MRQPLHGQQRPRLLSWLVRYVTACIPICLVVSSLVVCSRASEGTATRTSRLQDLTKIEIQASVDAHRVSDGISGAGSAPALSSSRLLGGGGHTGDVAGHFNTDFAERHASDVMRHEQQFLPLRLRDGYTGLHATYSSPKVSADHPVVYLAIGILTGPTTENRALRDSIRESWGKKAESVVEGQTVMYRFFAAIPPPPPPPKKKEKLTPCVWLGTRMESSCPASSLPSKAPPVHITLSLAELEDEAIKHGDMIILGHVDSFVTISKKTIAIMTWGSDLSGAYFVAKTDDDTFVHIPNTVRWLLKHGKENAMFAGISQRNATEVMPFHPERDTRHPFYISRSEFPFEMGGCYHQGAFFVTSRDVASHIGAIRKQPTYVWNRNEDVMAAMRVRELGGMTTTDDSKCFNELPILSYTLSTRCDKQLAELTDNGNTSVPVIAIHGVSATMMHQVQQNVEDPELNDDGICTDVKFTPHARFGFGRRGDMTASGESRDRALLRLHRYVERSRRRGRGAIEDLETQRSEAKERRKNAENARSKGGDGPLRYPLRAPVKVRRGDRGRDRAKRVLRESWKKAGEEPWGRRLREPIKVTDEPERGVDGGGEAESTERREKHL